MHTNIKHKNGTFNYWVNHSTHLDLVETIHNSIK